VLGWVRYQVRGQLDVKVIIDLDVMNKSRRDMRTKQELQ
jgi:hypothetical protein